MKDTERLQSNTCMSCGRNIDASEQTIIVEGGLLCFQCKDKSPSPISSTSAHVVEQAAASQFVVKCPKCGEGHNPGVFRCTKCNTSLRPTYLAVTTFFTILSFSLLAILCLIGAVVEQNPFSLVFAAICVAIIFHMIGLRKGKYWAWIAINVVAVIAIVLSVILIVISVFDPVMFLGEVVIMLGAVLQFYYLHSEKVKAFCSVGRPSK